MTTSTLPTSVKIITPELLQRLGVSAQRAAAWAPALAAAAPLADITTPLRVAAWLAQIVHESGALAFVREAWNPAQVPAQARYEGRKDLGNIYPGDGRKFLGRGPLQVTGRANYARCRDDLRSLGMRDCPDLEEHPEMLELPALGAAAAAAWWRRNRVNVVADRGDIDNVSSIVNRGRPGLVAMHQQQRRDLYAIACRSLGIKQG